MTIFVLCISPLLLSPSFCLLLFFFFTNPSYRAVFPILLIAIILILAAIVVGAWETLLSVDPEKIRTRKTFLLREMQSHTEHHLHAH